MRLFNCFFRANVFNPNPTPAVEFTVPGVYTVELGYGTYNVEVAGSGGGNGNGLVSQSSGGYGGAGDKKTTTININKKTQLDIYVAGWNDNNQHLQPLGYTQGTPGTTGGGSTGGYGGASSAVLIDSDLILKADGGGALWAIGVFGYGVGGNGSGGASGSVYSGNAQNAGNGLGGTRASNINGSYIRAGNGWVKISPVA